MLRIGPLNELVTWYEMNFAGTQITQWDFQNKGTRTSPARLSSLFHVTKSCKGPIYTFRLRVIIPHRLLERDFASVAFIHNNRGCTDIIAHNIARHVRTFDKFDYIFPTYSNQE